MHESINKEVHKCIYQHIAINMTVTFNKSKQILNLASGIKKTRDIHSNHFKYCMTLF